jgi:hypothetical protein
MDTVVERFLIPKFNELGMNATGQWLDSLETEARDPNIGVIRGQDYSEFLARGRAGGNMPPIEPIERWVNAKLGLYGSEATSAAWGIAKNIAAEGTTWYQQGGSDLLEVLESDEVISFIQNEYRTLVTVAIKNEFERNVKEIFV